MLDSDPYEFIKRKVAVRGTDTVIEIFYNTAPLRNTCQPITRLIWNGTVTASVNGQSGLEPILARLLTRFLPPKGLSNNPTEAVRGFSSWQISILTSGWKQRAERRFPTQLAQATRALKTSWHPGRITSIRSLRLPMLHQLRTNTPLLAALTTTGGKDHD